MRTRANRRRPRAIAIIQLFTCKKCSQSFPCTHDCPAHRWLPEKAEEQECAQCGTSKENISYRFKMPDPGGTTLCLLGEDEDGDECWLCEFCFNQLPQPLMLRLLARLKRSV